MNCSGYGKFSHVLNLIGFGFHLASFFSPSWIEASIRVPTRFNNLGLWTFCLNSFIARNDIEMKAYHGCWWIFSKELNTIRSILTPNWFVTTQVFMILTLIIYIICMILIIYYNFNNFKTFKTRKLVCQLILYLCLISGTSNFIASIVFGYNSQEDGWLCSSIFYDLSWGYGCGVVTAFCAYIAAIYMFKQILIENLNYQKEIYSFPLTNCSINNKIKEICI